MIGKSWKELSSVGEGINKEDFLAYLQRISSYGEYMHMPKAVLEQWHFLHHDNEWMIKNYGWIDYTQITFELQGWPLKKLKEVRVIKDFENTLTDVRSEFNRISALDEDYLHWQEHGTWRVPLIIIDSALALKIAPSWAEIHLPYQLVEGHTRMSNLLIADFQKLYLAESHQIYLMSLVL